MPTGLRSRPASAVPWRFACALVALAATGCGVEEYEARMDKTLKQLELADQFSMLERLPVTVAATPLALTGVKMRLPSELTIRVMNENSVNPDTGGGKIPPEKLQPPFVALPGTVIISEGRVSDARGILVPFHVHVAVESLDAPSPGEQKPADTAKPSDAARLGDAAKPVIKDSQAVRDAILAELTAAVGEKEPPLMWESVVCASPVAGKPPLEWQRLQVIHPQTFGISQSQHQVFPGVWSLWLYETPHRRVYLVWRVPETIADATKWEELAIRTAGTVETP